MNKWQIICPVAGMALLALFLALISGSRHRMAFEDAIAWRAHCIAIDLETKTNSTYLVSLPAPLEQALRKLLTSPTAYLDTYRRGDESPPLGDGMATHRIYIRNLDGHSIAVRLRYDPELEKFHALSFWQTNAWPE